MPEKFIEKYYVVSINLAISNVTLWCELSSIKSQFKKRNINEQDAFLCIIILTTPLIPIIALNVLRIFRNIEIRS